MERREQRRGREVVGIVQEDRANGSGGSQRLIPEAVIACRSYNTDLAAAATGAAGLPVPKVAG